MSVKVKKADDIPHVTNMLVNNPKFRNMVKATESNKKNFWFNIESYLDKELLAKDQPK